MKKIDFVALIRQLLFHFLLLSSIAVNAESTSLTEQASPTLSQQEASSIASRIQNQTEQFDNQLQKLLTQVEALPEKIHSTQLRISEIEKFWLAFILMFFAGWITEKLAALKLNSFTKKIEVQHESHWYTKVVYMLLASIFRLIALAIFTIAAITVPLIAYEVGDAGEILLISLLAVVVILRLISLAANAILAPWASGIRPLPMASRQAKRLYGWVMMFGVVYAIVMVGSESLLELGFTPIVISAGVIIMGLLLALVVIATIIVERHTINDMFKDNRSEPTPFRQIVSRSWPLLASIWILMLWCMWSFNIFLDNQQSVEKINIAWWTTIAFPMLDRLMYTLLNQIVSLPALQVGTFPQRSARIVSILLTGFRILLVGAALIALSEAWGWGSFAALQSSGGRIVLARLGDILVIGLLAYITWAAVRLMVEQKMSEEPEDLSSAEGEGDGAGATRTETLLPLLRSFILTILVVVVVLTVLHSLGIEIGPLLAGAGVIGIAIGFGAQKLVQDVISGIFFLLDDAFRRGEYIETGTLKGTVEKISMRSMQLRHHLGALQTVPYGEIGTVKNLSRDWVTMKLELRLPYNADLEKVRKTIKKIGQKLLEDEELGPQFILPLKSQGVVRTEESALIVRMKFTTHPGKQWVVRREAYQRVRDALSEAGIEFAHREVRVRLPEGYESLNENENTTNDSADALHKKQLAEQATAAAATAVLAAEAAKHNNIDNSGEDDR